MNKIKTEKRIVVVMFVAVLVVFSFAERDTKKLDKLYAAVSSFAQSVFLAKK
jgi:hypothetical protein